MSYPEKTYGLWYYPGINRFADEDGNILHDLFDLFSVWELDEWKRTQEYDILVDKNLNLCEMTYASEIEEEEFLRYIRQMKAPIGINLRILRDEARQKLMFAKII